MTSRSFRSARDRGQLGTKISKGFCKAARRAQALASAQHGELGGAGSVTGAERFDDRIDGAFLGMAKHIEA